MNEQIKEDQFSDAHHINVKELGQRESPKIIENQNACKCRICAKRQADKLPIWGKWNHRFLTL